MGYLRKNMGKVVVSIYPTVEQLKRLDKLSAKTKVPKAKYVREGIDRLLKKYEKQPGNDDKKRR
jgi:predicted DNA-binding protein